MKILKLIGNGYLVLGLLVLLAFFIRDCIANERFLLHFIGIFVLLPALAYSMWRLSDDITGYVRTCNTEIKYDILSFIIGKISSIKRLRTILDSGLHLRR